MSDFWVNANPWTNQPPPGQPLTTPPVGGVDVIQKTPAEQLPPAQAQPYDLLEGVTSNDTTKLQQSANTLFPLLDGTDTKLSAQTVYGGPGFANTTVGFPANFSNSPANLNPADFESWNTAYQLEYLADNGIAVPPNPNAATDQSLQIGASVVDANGKPVGSINVIAASAVSVPTDANPANMESLNVYVLQNLQKSDFAKMSLNDQNLIANTTYFQDTLSVSFGLVPSSSQNAPVNPSYNSSSANGGIGQIVVAGATTATYPLTTVTAAVPVNSVANAKKAMEDIIAGTQAQIVSDYLKANPSSSDQLNASDAQVFITELDNLRKEVSNQAVFSQTDIQSAISAIYQRWTVLKDFGTVVAPTAGAYGDSNQYANVISQDNNAGIMNGYSTLISAERRILDLQNQSMAVASSGALADKSLDVPDLIAVFQLYTNLTDEQINLASTQQVSQTNDLLATYGVIQNIVNATVKAFDTTNTSQKLGLYGEAGGTSIAQLISDHSLTTAQVQVISMFEDALGGKGQANPIEALNSVTRPNQDMYYNSSSYLNSFLKTSWDTFSTQLSDAVTLINQNSQILQNNITELQKEQDRHFDQANTALSKAADIISSIGRNVAD